MPVALRYRLNVTAEAVYRLFVVDWSMDSCGSGLQKRDAAGVLYQNNMLAHTV